MIANTFIKRPVTAIVISIVIVAVGLIALFNLPVAQYPDISPPQVSVSGAFTGADAQTVEQTTTTAIETQINGTPGMSYLSSTSTSDGRSSVNVTFNVGTNIDIAALDVQNRVSVAEPTLPDGVKRLGLTVRKRNPGIMMVISLFSPNNTHDATFLGNYSNIYIKDALLRVKGVGDILSFGDDFGMRIWLNPDKLASLNMTTNEVLAALQDQNVQVAAGSIGGAPQQSAQAFEYNVFTNSRINKKEEFEDIVVRSNGGSVTFLKDVARVELGKFTYANNAFVNGKRAAFMLIFQSPGANALQTYDAVNKAMVEMKKSFPKDVEYSVPYETVSVVSASIKEVIYTFMEALLLVIIVVFLFLQSWRATIIPVLAIPVSLIGTFVFFIPLGFSINTLTLFGMILAIGIVVDDAIVVVEAVQHNIDHEHMNPRQATYKAMKDISGPVIAIALILAAVFIPVGFIPGIVGRLYQQFAVTIAISVLISAFVALSLTPALCTILLKKSSSNKKQNFLDKFFGRFNRWFEKVTRSYTHAVSKWIKRSALVIVLLVCLFVGLAFLFKAKPTGFIPNEDQGYMFVTYELPEATSITRNIETLHKIIAQLSDIKAIKNTGAVAGLNAVSQSNKSNVGTIFILFKPWEERKGKGGSLDEIMADVNARMSRIKEANIMAIAPPSISGLGSTGGFTFELQKRESTDDMKGFEKASNDFLMALRKRPEIGMAYSFFNARTPGYQIDVDRVKAKKLGVNLTEVYSTMSTLLGSTYVNDFNLYGRNFRVMAQADTSYRGSLSSLEKYYVRNSSGSMIPLSALVTTKVIEQPAMIAHYNIFPTVEINGEPAKGYSSGQALQALEEVAKTNLPAGYGYEFSGLSHEEKTAGSSSLYIFLLSLAFVFLFLAALYESWAIPFSVLFAVPIGAFGSILTLTFIPTLSNNVYAQIGLITLIGLAAKNAILIVEFAKDRVDNGMNVIKATLQAVQLRLRPIVMTSLAFIFGVLPLAFATGAGAEARKTIGWTVFGGMLAATTLAIFVVPVLFVLITKIANRNKLKVTGENESDA
ncbi:MAG: multidrug efflux transporter permease subunit [Bacteroidota bacterium]|nr:multidrug efflux transporter permease subunit [Bacteroidota bacterium]